MIVYGVSVSYFTGKLEAYLRYKGVPYVMKSPFAEAKDILPHTGAIQVPMVLLEDGRWMSDSTPIIRYLDSELSGASVYPQDPALKFIALLIEDYADEWLWRAAMHYRWTYEHDRALLSRILVDEVADHLKVPRFMKLRTIANRQRKSFVLKDGVADDTQGHVEAGYFNALENMTEMLKSRPFLLGDAPCIADYGMMGPMLRHFGQDPTPAEIMRNKAPVVYEWVARVWNATEDEPLTLLETVPDDCANMLQEIAETHLVQLTGNARAFGLGQKKFNLEIQGCQYKDLPVSRYRVHCLEQLRQAYESLPIDAQASVQKRLPYQAADIIWQPDLGTRSEYDVEGLAPFNKAINVYGKGTPE